MSVIVFHSRSKSEFGKLLSSFSNLPCKLENETFPTVEHAFQAAKCSFVQEKCKKEANVLKEVIKGLKTAKEAKQYGGKKMFLKYGVLLNIYEWEANKVEVMKSLIQSRFEMNIELIKQLKKFPIETKFEHYSLRDKYWGCYHSKKTNTIVGCNMLGQIINEYFKEAKKMEEEL